jgi:hypothetical protein
MGLVRAAIAGTDAQEKEGVEVTVREPNGHEPYLQPSENDQNSSCGRVTFSVKV